MLYNEIVGHQQIITILKNAVISDRVAHSYLFYGAPLIGKKTVARAFAQSLVCNEPIDGAACGSCVSCHKVAGGNHPDIHYIEPAGTTLKIEQVRNIQKEVKLKPFEGGKKVFIISQAESLTGQAANSLLKTLEEPPEHTVFILVADNPYTLLPTILSRCQHVPFNKVPVELIKEMLITKIQIEPKRAGFISVLSDGNPGYALQLVESEDILNKRDSAIDLAILVQKGNYLDFYKQSEELEKNKDDIIKILDFTLGWYRDILVWQETGQENLLLNLDRKDVILQQGRQEPKSILKCISIIEKIKHQIQSNVNLRLALEVMMLSLNNV